jgi:hypothetical protein
VDGGQYFTCGPCGGHAALSPPRKI